MPVMSIGLPVDSIRLGDTGRGDTARRHRVEGSPCERQPFNPTAFSDVQIEADLIFREDAESLGYLTKPRGMARYYRDHGILPPRYVNEDLPRREFTNFDIERIESSK